MGIKVRSVRLGENAGVPESWLALLDDEEIRRWKAFRLDRDRLSFAAAHALTRLMLAEATGRHPRSLVFGQAATGKPYLADQAQAPCFSLSHTAGCAAVACSEHPVGLDVEAVDRAVLDEGLVRLVTGSETMDVETFFDIWTAKEAVAKAEGFGLSLPLENIHLMPALQPQGGSAGVRLPDGEEHIWYLWRHAPSPRHRLALAHGGTTVDNAVLEKDHLTAWSESFNQVTRPPVDRPLQGMSCTF